VEDFSMASAAIKIEKGIPLPPGRGGPSRVKYPFKDMEVGDSFVALLADSSAADLLRLQGSLGNCAKAAIGPSKIATRKLPDGSGFRVWRIA
jgi:hypothetical protein